MTTRATTLAALLLLAGGATLNAGPLDPPGGPVAPSMKTLDQVEPRIPVNPQTCPGDEDSVFRIDQPGSYYLTGDLHAEAGKTAIEVTATGITLDLSGYSIEGAYEALSGIRFVEEPGQVRDVTVRNGRIRGFTAPGIDAGVVPNLLVEDMRIVGCANGVVAASRARVSRCHIADMNGSTALVLGLSSTVEDCVILGASKGIVATDSLTVRDTSVNFATLGGIKAGDNALIHGVSMQSASTYGVQVDEGATITNCSISGTFAPIQALSNARIEGCTISSCLGDAIVVSSNCTVTGCNIYYSTGNGIVATLANVITNNYVGYCNANGEWAGIKCTNALNKVDGNHLIGNDIGLQVTSTNNFIVRNTVSASATPFSVVGGNDIAPIITNPGTAFTGATPWSNFAF